MFREPLFGGRETEARPRDGHVLGMETLRVRNGVYVTNTFHLIGTHGLAAYQAEFHQAIAVIPVENAGNPGTPIAHWDQLMRSSSQEGNPSDPRSLDPRVGVVDQDGRDRGLERMTGAINPDDGEPFLARCTMESMRDLGCTVARFEDFNWRRGSRSARRSGDQLHGGLLARDADH